ncbi:hypothetical protein OKW34_000514 [Paraburkholderia youngii]
MKARVIPPHGTDELGQQRLEAIDRQIADLERRRLSQMKTLSEGTIPPLE